ncbi:MAG: 3-oxoacyl-ACP synthase III family protein [Parafilimonas sp.]
MNPGLTIKNIMHVEVSGSGIAFSAGGKWISNNDIHALIFGDDWQQKMIDKKLDPSYYEKETGFKNRFWVHAPGTVIKHDELTSADLMIEAANNAIKNSSISKNEIDFVIAVTITSPRYSTSMGAYIAGKLGINAPAIEMKSGCASNIFSIVMAAQLIQSGARNVLIACGETNSKILQPGTNMLYAGGDAGAAIIVSKSTDAGKGIVAAYLNTDGSFSGHMGVPGLMPPNEEDIINKNYFLTYSNAAESFLDEAWQQTPAVLYKAAGYNSSDIDCLIPHQVLKKRTQFISNASGIDINKTVDILADYANCGSASLLLALDHARKDDQLKKDNTAMLVAAGGGVSWGGIILKT